MNCFLTVLEPLEQIHTRECYYYQTNCSRCIYRRSIFLDCTNPVESFIINVIHLLHANKKIVSIVRHHIVQSVQDLYLEHVTLDVYLRYKVGRQLCYDCLVLSDGLVHLIPKVVVQHPHHHGVTQIDVMCEAPCHLGLKPVYRCQRGVGYKLIGFF